jgi:hypothetical protein
MIKNHAFLELVNCLEHDRARRKAIYLDIDTKPTTFDVIIKECLAQIDWMTIGLDEWIQREHGISKLEPTSGNGL